MSKLYRSLLWTGFLALGIAACGDDVTVTPPPPPPPAPEPGIRSVTVAPDGASLQVGSTLQMTAAVTLDPGAATPTIAWSTSDASKATVSSAGLVTGVAPGSAGIRATATSGTSTGQGLATVNVVAAPTCQVSGVVVTPTAANLVVGQTVQASAAVNGTAQCSQNVTWASLTPGVATVSAAGLVTAVAGGNAVIRATSVSDPTKSAALAVTVVVPSPATVSIQSITTGNLATPVNLTNVMGQIEVSANVDAGDKVLNRLDVLIDGVVVATQVYPAPAPAAAPSSAPVVNVISTNTAQVRKVGGLFVPVVYNGNANITLNLWVVGASAPIASNTVPVVMNNPDAITTNGANGPIAVALANPAAPSFTDSSPKTWYQSHVNFSGINYMAFGGVNPASVAVGNTLGCANSNTVSGTPTGGVSVTGTWTCTGLEGSVAFSGAFPVVAVGAPPAPEVTVTGPAGWSRVSTAFVVGGDNIAAPADPRYNLLSGGSTSSSLFWVDWKAPTTALTKPIGFLAGTTAGGDPAPFNCEETGITPGCWINNSGPIAGRFATTDLGSGALGGNTTFVRDYTAGGVSCSAALLPTGTGADYAETTTANAYRACAHGVDPIGNANSQTIGAGGAVASNAFSNDNTTPTFAYVGTYPVSGTNPAEVAVLPAAPALDSVNFSLTDNNSGIDATVALSFTFTKTVNVAGAQAGPTTLAVAGCPNPGTLMTGSGNTPQTMLTPYLISSCALPGERTWAANGTDRAGNTSATITRQLEYNPAAPTINAVNIVPNYAAAAALPLDVLAGDDEDLRSVEITGHYTTNVGNDVQIVFGPLGGFGQVWGSDWDASLYLTTTLGVDSRVSIPASYSLAAYVESAAAIPAGTAALDTLSTRVFDTFGTPSAATVVALNPAFVVASSFGGTNAWAGTIAGVIGPAITNPGGTSCAFEYSTPTNNPQILTRIWGVNDNAAGVYTVLKDVSGTPALLSDNGIQRLYRHVISSSMTCAAAGWGIAGGVNNIIAVQGNMGWEIF